MDFSGSKAHFGPTGWWKKSSPYDFTTKNTNLVHTKVENSSKMAKMGHFGSFRAFFRPKIGFFWVKNSFWAIGMVKNEFLA